MNLRGILIALSLLVIVYTAIGGYIHYNSMRDSAFESAYRRTVAQAEVLGSQLSMFLSRNQKPVRTMARQDELALALKDPSAANLAEANAVLDLFQSTLEVDVCYLMDKNGVTVASSNRLAPDSFVGKSFFFRPYYKTAIIGGSATYMALGTTSGKRGVYYSHPVEGPDGPLGVVVIKAPVSPIEQEYVEHQEGIAMLVDPHGIIFMSNQPDMLYRSLRPLSQDQMESLMASRQFGDGPWAWSGLEPAGENRIKGKDGSEYLMHEVGVGPFSGWKLVYMRDLSQISREVLSPALVTTGSAVLVLFLLTAASVSILYAKANKEIGLRKAAERELMESRERYRSLYHHTPALLHSIDAEGRFVSVSEHWLEVMGYAMEEVVGHELTEFMSPESKKQAQEKVLPEFFRTGECRNTPYVFIKKNGQPVDVLLSAIAERDAQGRIYRSLAVLVDVTDQKRAELELFQAQKQLQRYSEDLERQVMERTREISRLSGAVIAGQEQERAAIARELHDELGQILTALRLDAVWLRERLRDGDVMVAARTRTMCELIDSSINDIRSIATRLRPAVLDDLGLIDALEWFTTDLEKRTGAACVFVHRGVGKVGGPKATAAYRIAQEALVNATRHGSAANMELKLERRDKEYVIRITDDGIGFDPDAVQEDEGLGIAGMRERALLAGGSLDICSAPGRGTVVVFKMPV